MTLATLADVLGPALSGGYAVAGLVVLGWEDARAYVDAAESEGLPVILQAGPGCRRHTPLEVMAAMFRTLGNSAGVPVVAHLDHATSIKECRHAIDCGFTSVMFDGSHFPLEQNIELTAEAAQVAHSAGVSCEGEIGIVGHSGGKTSSSTDPDEAEQFARSTGIDAMAISVGNLHLQRAPSATIELDRIRAVESVVNIPLVLHGGSGIDTKMRQRLAAETAVCKFNIGTELRMVFGKALRSAMKKDPNRFDRVEILKETEEPVRETTRSIIRSIGPQRLSQPN